nr:zinc finger ccch domain-containing protein 48 [Quercus suber]
MEERDWFLFLAASLCGRLYSLVSYSYYLWVFIVWRLKLQEEGYHVGLNNSFSFFGFRYMFPLKRFDFIASVDNGKRGKERLRKRGAAEKVGAGQGGHLNNSSNKICKFWLSGRCLKNPCRFAHSETPDVATIHRHRQTPYYPHSSNALVSNTWRRGPRNSQNVQEKVVKKKSESDLEDIKKKLAESVSEGSSECSVVENDSNLENVVEEKPLEHVPKKTTEMVCEFWVQGTCVYGDQCPYLHSWFRGDKFKRLAELQGHNKVPICV